MASQIDRPFRGTPEDKSQHVVLEYIAQWQKKGYFKPCANLTVSGGWSDGAMKYFNYQPVCEKDSFHIEENSDDNNAEYFWGCPENCHCFERKWWRTTLKFFRDRWFNFKGLISVCWGGFTSLSPWVQSAFVFGIVILILGLAEGKTILEILREYVVTLRKDIPK